jgi:UDP-N-acetylglucosamine acyltransferase
VKIHSTAIIEPGATIGIDVEVGPYACIGARVTIGDRSKIFSHAVLEGEVILGSDNVIGHGAVIGSVPQDLSFKEGISSGVAIGARNIIREHCTIHRGATEGSKTIVGDGNYLMAGAHLGHNVRLSNRVIVANNCLLGGYVEIADGAFLGGGCVFHQHVRVGRLVITQGLSGFGKDIPPFVIAARVNQVAGLNVVGLRRAGIAPAERDEIKAAFKLLYTSGHNVTQALAVAKRRKWNAGAQEFFAFVSAAAKRGICGYKSAEA